MNLESASASKDEISEAEGYSLLQTLSEGRSFLCTDVSSNIVALKKLDEDCIHRNQLHPSIRERLAHVRDLPHPRLATLRGVERWNHMPCMVWTWLDGESWDDSLAKSTDDFPALSSALVDAVDALHELGVVHGSLHGRNIIVRPDRQVWLTHVSPYLYTDDAGDIFALIHLLDAAAAHLPPVISSRLGLLLDELQAGQLDLRQLSHALRNVADPVIETSTPKPITDRGHRTKSMAGALMVALIGAGVWFGIHRWFTEKMSSAPTTFPSLKGEARQ